MFNNYAYMTMNMNMNMNMNTYVRHRAAKRRKGWQKSVEETRVEKEGNRVGTQRNKEKGDERKNIGRQRGRTNWKIQSGEDKERIDVEIEEIHCEGESGGERPRGKKSWRDREWQGGIDKGMKDIYREAQSQRQKMRRLLLWRRQKGRNRRRERQMERDKKDTLRERDRVKYRVRGKKRHLGDRGWDREPCAHILRMWHTDLSLLIL
jgi:hypothetical protein